MFCATSVTASQAPPANSAAASSTGVVAIAAAKTSAAMPAVHTTAIRAEVKRRISAPAANPRDQRADRERGDDDPVTGVGQRKVGLEFGKPRGKVARISRHW